jgi:hypothetical protein
VHREEARKKARQLVRDNWTTEERTAAVNL